MSWFFEKATQIQRTDDWDFYFCHVDGKPASILLDLGRRAEIPLKGYPQMTYLRLYMRAANENGLSSEAEFIVLRDIEDSLEPAVQKSGALYVGRKTGDGMRDYYFYTSDAANFERAARDAMKPFPAYAFETGHRPDENWSVYLEFLYPNAAAMSTIQNRRVLAVLEREGDDSSLPHKIDHRVHFDSGDQRLSFSSRVLRLGYQIEAGNEDEEEDDIFLDFYRSDDLAEIDAITTEIHEILNETGGKYDGWGTSVETPKDGPAP